MGRFCNWMFVVICCVWLFVYVQFYNTTRSVIVVSSRPTHKNYTFFIVPGGWTDIAAFTLSCSCKVIKQQHLATVLIWFPPNGSRKPVKLPHQKLVVWSREPRAFAPNPWEDSLTVDLAMTYELTSNVPISYLPKNFVKTIWSLPTPSKQDFDGRRTAIW